VEQDFRVVQETILFLVVVAVVDARPLLVGAVVTGVGQTLL
jgi:hypothetical protein